MNKTILLSSILGILFLSGMASAALGLGASNEYNQGKELKKYPISAFTFGEDKVSEGKLELTSGGENGCVSITNQKIMFNSEGIGYGELIIDTSKEGCEKGIEGAKIKLSPATSVSSAGTVGMNLAVVKSFDVVTVSTSTFAIVIVAVLVIAVLALIGAMVKVAKKRN